MPIEITINHDDQIVYAICHGRVTPPDIQHYQCETWNSTEIKGYGEFFDVRKGDVSDFSSPDAVTTTNKDNEKNSSVNKTAIVISAGWQKRFAIAYAMKPGLNPDNPRTIEYFFISSIALDWLKK